MANLTMQEKATEDARYLRSFHDEAKWWPIADRIDALAACLSALEAERDTWRTLATALHEEVEMAESVGICLPDRVPTLNIGAALASTGDNNAG